MVICRSTDGGRVRAGGEGWQPENEGGLGEFGCNSKASAAPGPWWGGCLHAVRAVQMVMLGSAASAAQPAVLESTVITRGKAVTSGQIGSFCAGFSFCAHTPGSSPGLGSGFAGCGHFQHWCQGSGDAFVLSHCVEVGEGSAAVPDVLGRAGLHGSGGLLLQVLCRMWSCCPHGEHWLWAFPAPLRAEHCSLLKGISNGGNMRGLPHLPEFILSGDLEEAEPWPLQL